MSQLEGPAEPSDLYLARADEVNPNRPLMTGDVLTDVTLPILGSAPPAVIVLAHPCSMRTNGIELASLLHVAPVVAFEGASPPAWRGSFKVMSLPDLDVAPTAVVSLDRMTLVESTKLDLDRRVACLSRLGINLLRQRFVHHLSRVIVPTHVFDSESAGAHEELDLMEEWLDAAIDAGHGIETAGIEFMAWVRDSAGGDSRQRKLESPQSVASVRRELVIELETRYPRQ